MNFASALQHKLMLGIQRLMQLDPVPAPQAHSYALRSAVRPIASHKPRVPTVRGIYLGAESSKGSTKPMPLRVLRVVDNTMPRSSTGRMVISGRMADVCAELDRLVEREAALH